MKRKTSLLGVLAFLFSISSFVSAAETVKAPHVPEGWLTSFSEAQARAKRENKYIMAYFTGSDWCGYCQVLDKEVFSKKEFRDWAKKNVIPLYLDFPKLSKLPPNLEKQNYALLKKFGVNAFPIIFFIDKEGQVLTSTGYIAGGARNWIRNNSMLLPKKLSLTMTFADAFRESRKNSKPIVVAAYVGDYDASVTNAVSSFLQRPGIISNSGENFLLVKLDLTKTDADSLSLWRRTVAENKIGKSYPAFVMLDGNLRQIFAANGKKQSVQATASDILSKVRKPIYNGEWLTDYPKALKIARALNRPLLLNFTGSDWCGFCHKLRDELFVTKAFKDYAKNNLVLVELDYPKTKQLQEPLATQNKVIAQAFGIESFPLVVIMSNSGIPLSAMSYTGKKPEQYISLIKNVLQSKTP